MWIREGRREKGGGWELKALLTVSRHWWWWWWWWCCEEGAAFSRQFHLFGSGRFAAALSWCFGCCRDGWSQRGMPVHRLEQDDGSLWYQMWWWDDQHGILSNFRARGWAGPLSGAGRVAEDLLSRIREKCLRVRRGRIQEAGGELWRSLYVSQDRLGYGKLHKIVRERQNKEGKIKLCHSVTL